MTQLDCYIGGDRYDATIRIYWANANHKLFGPPSIYWIQKWNEEKKCYNYLYGSYRLIDCLSYAYKHFLHYGWMPFYNSYLKKYEDVHYID